MATLPQLRSIHIILIWHLPPTPGIGELEVRIVALRDIPATHIPSQDIAIICHSTQHILRGHIPSGCLTKDMELHLLWIETGIIHNPSKVSSIIKLLVTMFFPVLLKDNSFGVVLSHTPKLSGANTLYPNVHTPVFCLYTVLLKNMNNN